MERDSENSKGLEWENLSSIEIPNQIGFPMSTSRKASYLNNPTTSNNPNSFSQHFSTTDSIAATNTCTYDNSVTKKQNVTGTSSIPSSSEPAIGLRLGENRESLSRTSMATRTPRTSMQNPCCQVEGCHIDLTSAKDYHRRHRICENHSKSPKVIVAGMERRFCQQCSRFHDLAEFDDKKRSCRRRLSVHNARRRRMQPESIHLNTGLSSALYDRRPPNLPLNGLPVSGSRSAWENGGSSMFRQARDTLNRPTSSARQLGRTAMQHFSNNDIPNPTSSIQSSCPQVLEQCLNVPTTISPNAPDLEGAPSLLSTTTSWSMNEAESRTMESLLVQGNYSPAARERYQLDNFRVEQPDHSLNMQNVAGPSQMQEFELFKARYESDCFYPGQRNL